LANLPQDWSYIKWVELKHKGFWKPAGKEALVVSLFKDGQLGLAGGPFSWMWLQRVSPGLAFNSGS
jgi:hypothetical protein